MWNKIGPRCFAAFILISYHCFRESENKIKAKRNIYFIFIAIARIVCIAVRRSSVCLSHHSTAAAACGGFAAECRSGWKYRLTAARAGHPAATTPQHGAQQQMRTVPCWQPSWRSWTQTCFILLPTRRYGPVSVCHKSAFYQNGWTNRAGFWHGSLLRPILYYFIRKFKNKGTSLWTFPPDSGLSKFRHSISIVEACY